MAYNDKLTCFRHGEPKAKRFRVFAHPWIASSASGLLAMTVVMLFLSGICFAPAHASIALLSPTQQDKLHRIEAYLSGLDSIVADFIQASPEGDIVSGAFYFRRPDKMRWQYDPPTPILMVTRGRFLTFYDYELDQVNDIPLDDTLIGFLARKDIRFDDSVKVIAMEEEAGAIRVRLVKSDRPDEGMLTLEFSDDPLLIRNIIVRDAAGQETTVALNNARFGIELADELFVFRDPRLGGAGPGGKRRRN